MDERRCTEYGHEHYRLPCTACRSEALATHNPAPALTISPEQAARNTAGAHHARTQLDHARLAAGEREDQNDD